MGKITIVFLGTGSAIPTITRNHSSIFFRYKEKNILIDCGEGTQRQIRKAKINPCKITDILITHFHGDHFFGLPGLLNTLSKSGYNKTLNIYGPKGSKKIFDKVSDIANVNLNINFKEVSGKFMDNPYFSLTAMPLDHRINCNGYLFQEKDRLRIDKKKLSKLKLKKEDFKKLNLLSQGKNIKINGKTIKSKDLTYKINGRKVSFIFDTKTCTNAIKLAKDCNLAIIESSFLEDTKLAKEYHHLTLNDTLKIAKKAKVKKLILTHISQRYEHRENSYLKKAKKEFKNLEMAKDLMKIEI